MTTALACNSVLRLLLLLVMASLLLSFTVAQQLSAVEYPTQKVSFDVPIDMPL